MRRSTQFSENCKRNRLHAIL